MSNMSSIARSQPQTAQTMRLGLRPCKLPHSISRYLPPSSSGLEKSTTTRIDKRNFSDRPGHPARVVQPVGSAGGPLQVSLCTQAGGCTQDRFATSPLPSCLLMATDCFCCQPRLRPLSTPGTRWSTVCVLRWADAPRSHAKCAEFRRSRMHHGLSVCGCFHRARGMRAMFPGRLAATRRLASVGDGASSWSFSDVSRERQGCCICDRRLLPC
ncbi:hypothetical protein IWZ01DRAFT_35934 [Phyllosticta capitalensis]